MLLAFGCTLPTPDRCVSLMGCRALVAQCQASERANDGSYRGRRRYASVKGAAT